MKHTMEELSKLHKDFLNGMYYDYEETSTKLIDIITIIGSLFFYDRNNKKSNELTLTIPVFNPSYWEEEILLVSDLFEWITDEPIQLQFTEEKHHFQDELIFLLPNNLDSALFYDDLESLAGLYLADNRNEEFDYIHLVNKNNDKVKQQKLNSFLVNSVSLSTEIVQAKLKYFHTTKAKNTASLNLVLCSLAVLKAYYNGGQNVYFYQSNKINLNYENSTTLIDKGTHQRTYKLLNELFQNASINVPIQLPFLHKTRSDIIRELPKDYKLQIKNTSDCIRKNRSGKNGETLPCGICKPCLQRKMMMTATNNEVYDGFYQYDYGTKVEQISNEQDQQILKETLQTFQTLSELLKNKLESLPTTEEKVIVEDFITSFHSFIEKYNPN